MTASDPVPTAVSCQGVEGGVGRSSPGRGQVMGREREPRDGVGGSFVIRAQSEGWRARDGSSIRHGPSPAAKRVSAAASAQSVELLHKARS